MEYADGTRRPMILTFFWEPVRADWTLEFLGVFNAPLAELSGLEY